MNARIKIGIVGPCGSGKSELIRRLTPHGFSAKHIAQEHSFTPDMWRRLTNPDILIYLDVSYPVTLERKPFTWTQAEYDEQKYRLRHAYAHAELIINTDLYTPDEIGALVLNALSDLKPNHS